MPVSSRFAHSDALKRTMETTDCPTEGEPLKSGEDGVEPPATELKRGCKEVLGLSKLTHWRTAVFFLSLFLCLTVVFAFSFIIPCPVRPQYLASWNRTFPGAGVCVFFAPPFLIVSSQFGI